MHGLINRSIQNYVCDRYGVGIWLRAAAEADLTDPHFEGMLIYDDALTPKVIDAIARVVGYGREEVLENIGTYLVSHPNTEAVRRLLRFGGIDFVDFLHSLDDLPARTRLALPDLRLPTLELHEEGEGQFNLKCESLLPGVGHLVMGGLRAMADDYGALALLEHTGAGARFETISVKLIETEYAEGRAFELGARAS